MAFRFKVALCLVRRFPQCLPGCFRKVCLPSCAFLPGLSFRPSCRLLRERRPRLVPRRGLGWACRPAWPQTCTVSDTIHCVLNPTSRPAGGFPAASTPSPFPRRVGLLSKVGRPWEVPRPPQGATPLGTGAHPRVPCVSKRCWGWYPEPPDSPAPLALQPQGGGWADGPNRVPQRFAGHRLPGAEAPQRDFVLPQRASVPLGEAWALPW